MTIYSMTGYGQARRQGDAGTVTVEIRTVNHRYSEIVVRGTREFTVLEDAVRQRIKAQLSRGRMDVFVSFEPASDTGQVEIDWAFVEQLTAATTRLAAQTGATAPTTLDYLQVPGVMGTPVGVSAEDVRDLLLTCVDEAATAVAAMRRREGERLVLDLDAKLSEVRLLADQLQERAPKVLLAMRERLESRMKELAGDIDPNRVMTEIAVLADKVAIDEEITRLSSHIEEFTGTLVDSKPVGRRLDFIIQEMNREVNTIASKAPDIILSKVVVALKAVIEQMREQVQNIE